MLTQDERDSVWKRMILAEVRSLYFADLATKYTRQKQILAAVLLFLSSGAAVTVGAKGPSYLTLGFSVVAAATAAYTIGFGLDKQVTTLIKLHCSWNELHWAYRRLWNHWNDDDASRILDDLVRRAREASELGTEAPYKESLVEKWEDRVYAQYSTDVAA